jgi:N6-L-threonylcarbamoyladenine synthase
MMDCLKVLGIESSCDDTASAVITVFHENNKFIKAEINSSIVFNQNQIHADYGGVVPELAARAHVEKLDLCVESALIDSGKTLSDINIICVTSGPGLIGGLISGVIFAKTLSFGLNKPLIGVNHLVGHALTPRLTHSTQYPYLILIASGGHCQFLIAKGPSSFIRLGGTIDDAPGEAFDKTARILELEYPGGPAVETQALEGDPYAYKLPLPLVKQKNCNMSFSGLKTALKREVNQIIDNSGGLSEPQIKNLCASFQSAVTDIFVDKTKKAMVLFKTHFPKGPHTIAIAGGVAANKSIGLALSKLAHNFNFKLVIPDPQLCTDNAAMIASAGAELFLNKEFSSETLIPRPRWPLDSNASPMMGFGKKGRKA